jgi:hypothetical protein
MSLEGLDDSPSPELGAHSLDSIRTSDFSSAINFQLKPGKIETRID